MIETQLHNPFQSRKTIFLNTYKLRTSSLTYPAFYKSLKLTPLKGLTKLPISWCDVVACHSSTVTSGNFKREALTIKVGIALPILTPISWHGLPASFWPFDWHCMGNSCTRDVGDQNQVEVRVAIDCEPYSSLFYTWHSSIITK
jgi:hypothetical protein